MAIRSVPKATLELLTRTGTINIEPYDYTVDELAVGIAGHGFVVRLLADGSLLIRASEPSYGAGPGESLPTIAIRPIGSSGVRLTAENVVSR